MVDKPIDPSHLPKPQGPTPSQGPDKSEKVPAYFSKGKWHAKPMTWLGMHFTSDEATKLWNVIVQAVGSAINKDKAKALKALKKLRGDHPEDS